ncbi:kinase-like domain-containing protein [Gigaspora margarita]|uniref:Kinase-like domain-containing protein n=1 Tax=Gigaspora margarita TaxID=4874 RepID=A0A8H4ENM4_GIGMA|nr:kinase-like domain-containing protein [Gigaspora margarita]
MFNTPTLLQKKFRTIDYCEFTDLNILNGNIHKALWEDFGEMVVLKKSRKRRKVCNEQENTKNIFVHEGKMMIAAHLMKKGTDHVYEPIWKRDAETTTAAHGKAAETTPVEIAGTTTAAHGKAVETTPAEVTETTTAVPAAGTTTDNRYESLSYAAPEVLLAKNITYQTDIYSFGIILYEIMTGLSPHQNLTPDNLNIRIIGICNGLKPVLQKNIPEPVEHLITQCWDSDPSQRPKIDELNDVLRHMNSDAFEKEDAETTRMIKVIDLFNATVMPKENNLAIITTHALRKEPSRRTKIKRSSLQLRPISSIAPDRITLTITIQPLLNPQILQGTFLNALADKRCKNSTLSPPGFTSSHLFPTTSPILPVPFEEDEKTHTRGYWTVIVMISRNENASFSHYQQCEISQVGYCYQNGYQVFSDYKKIDEMHKVIYNIGKVTYYMNFIENFIYGLIYLVLFERNSRGMNVGDCYFRGIGVERDGKKAFEQKLNNYNAIYHLPEALFDHTQTT